MIDLIKSRVKGQPAIVNVGGHDWGYAQPFLLRIAKVLEANAILVHELRTDISSAPSLESIPSKIAPLDGGKLLKNGVVVATVMGLPVSPDLAKRYSDSLKKK